MFIIIDLEKMVATHKHPDIKAACNLMYLELPHKESAALCLTEGICYLGRFTDLELKLLHLNLCGQKFEGYDRDLLERTIFALLGKMEVTPLDADELERQAALIELERDGMPYRYVRGSAKPAPETNLFNHNPKPITKGPDFEPVPPAPATPATPPAAPPAHASAPVQPTPPAAAPKPPRAPSAAPAGAPKAGSKTGKVWEIAERVWVAGGSPSDPKELRQQIVDACGEEGINGSTAGVQYSKWRKFKMEA